MKEAAYFLRGKVRKETLLMLKERPNTATEIGKYLNKHRSSISRILTDLSDDGYAKCDNPKDDKYRFYSLTGNGLKILEKTEEYQK